MTALLYLLAAVGAATVAVLMWRAFGPERTAASPSRPVAPDDDPDFLRRLGQQEQPDSDPE